MLRLQQRPLELRAILLLPSVRQICVYKGSMHIHTGVGDNINEAELLDYTGGNAASYFTPD